MYFIMYHQTAEGIYQDMDHVATRLIQGWKLYAYTDNEQLAYSFLNECKHQ